MLYIGLDPGSSWAGYFTSDGDWEVFHCAKGSGYSRTLGMAADLVKAIKSVSGPSRAVVGIETPVLRSAKAHEVQWRLIHVIQLLLPPSRFTLRQIHSGTVKKHLTGNGGAKKPEMLKVARKQVRLPRKGGDDFLFTLADAYGIMRATQAGLGEELKIDHVRIETTSGRTKVGTP